MTIEKENQIIVDAEKYAEQYNGDDRQDIHNCLTYIKWRFIC